MNFHYLSFSFIPATIYVTKGKKYFDHETIRKDVQVLLSILHVWLKLYALAHDIMFFT
jgi:hypothetical protein